MGRLIITCLLVSVSCFGSTQGKVPVSDPVALGYAAQSIAAMSGSTAIGDVTLTGTIAAAPGSTSETGTATLLALGTAESRMDLVLSGGTQTEIRDAQTGTTLGEWVKPNGSTGLFAFHNCQTDAAWFFPVLGSLAVGSNVVLSYVGQETRNGESVQHIQSYIYQSLQPTSAPSTQQLSTMDFYLDATTLLPTAITYNAHPDNDETTNLLVEVDFSDFQSMSGVMVPTRIQRFQQGDLMVDVTVSGASFNTGLSLSIFAIN